MEARFSATVQTGPWGPPSLLYNGYRVFPGGKAAESWRWPPTPSNAEVKERVEPYLSSPSVPLWQVIGWTVPSLSQKCPNQLWGPPSHIFNVYQDEVDRSLQSSAEGKDLWSSTSTPPTLHGVMLNYLQEQLNLPTNAQQLHAAESILIIWQLISKSPVILQFTTEFMTYHDCIASWATWIQSTPFHHISPIFTIPLSSHETLTIQTKIKYISRLRATCTDHLIRFHSLILKILGILYKVRVMKLLCLFLTTTCYS